MLIHGNFEIEIPKIKSNSIDLIIADIPWLDDNTLNLSYDSIFSQLHRVLDTKGLCIITVDTGTSIIALLAYCFGASKYFQFRRTMVYIEGNNFGNIVILEHRGDGHTFHDDNKIIYLDKIYTQYPNSKDNKLYDFIIRTFSKENDMVLDPFMGIGTTGKVCDRLSRRFIGIELNNECYEVACQRS